MAIGSSSDLIIGPYASLIIGFIGGMVSVIGYVYIQPFLEKKYKLHDTCGVHNLHGLPGIIGGLSGAISASSASKNVYGDNLENIFVGIQDGRSCTEQGGYQFATLLMTFGISIAGGLITGKFMSYLREVDKYGEDDENWEFTE